MIDTELPFHISCRDCSVSRADSSAAAFVTPSVCDDCIVTYFCGPDEQPSPRERSGRSLSLSADEARTVRLFQGAELAPLLRHSRRLRAVPSS